jgi:hypothetical protein
MQQKSLVTVLLSQIKILLCETPKVKREKGFFMAFDFHV